MHFWRLDLNLYTQYICISTGLSFSGALGLTFSPWTMSPYCYLMIVLSATFSNFEEICLFGVPSSAGPLDELSSPLSWIIPHWHVYTYTRSCKPSTKYFLFLSFWSFIFVRLRIHRVVDSIFGVNQKWIIKTIMSIKYIYLAWTWIYYYSNLNII